MTGYRVTARLDRMDCDVMHNNVIDAIVKKLSEKFMEEYGKEILNNLELDKDQIVAKIKVRAAGEIAKRITDSIIIKGEQDEKKAE